MSAPSPARSRSTPARSPARSRSRCTAPGLGSPGPCHLRRGARARQGGATTRGGPAARVARERAIVTMVDCGHGRGLRGRRRPRQRPARRGRRSSTRACSRPSPATSSSSRAGRDARRSAVPRGDREARHRRSGQGVHRVVERRHARARPAADGARDLLAEGERHRQPVRAAAGTAWSARSTSTRSSWCASTTTRPARRRPAVRRLPQRRRASVPHDVKPLEITQPDGPGFELDGHGCAGRTGTSGSASTRARASCCTTSPTTTPASGARSATAPRSPSWSIPYGDPNPTTHFKNVVRHRRVRPRAAHQLARRWAATAWGRSATSTRVTNTYTGDVVRDPERDLHPRGGLRPALEAHRRGRPRRPGARSRRLVISSIATVGNYEYGFFWYLYQDGTIAVRGEADRASCTPRAGSADERSPYSLPLGEGFVTSHHQHFFCARLDLDVDGTANTAFESEAVREPWGAGNPDGVAFRPERRTYRRESDGRGRSSPETARRFRVENPARRNRIGDPVVLRARAGRHGARRCSSPTRPSASARGSSTTTCG